MFDNSQAWWVEITSQSPAPSQCTWSLGINWPTTHESLMSLPFYAYWTGRLKGKFSTGTESALALTLQHNFNWKQLSEMMLSILLLMPSKLTCVTLITETSKTYKSENWLWLLGVGVTFYYDLQYNAVKERSVKDWLLCWIYNMQLLCPYNVKDHIKALLHWQICGRKLWNLNSVYRFW